MTESEIVAFFDRHYPDWLPWGGIFRHVSIRPEAGTIIQPGPVLGAPGEICFSETVDTGNGTDRRWLSVIASTQDGDIYLETSEGRESVSLPYVGLFFRALQEAHDRLRSEAERNALVALRERVTASLSRLATDIRHAPDVIEIPHSQPRFFRKIVGFPSGRILMPIAAPEMRKPGPLFVAEAHETGLTIIRTSILNEWAVVNWPSAKLALAYGNDCQDLFSQMISFHCHYAGLSGHETISMAETTRPLVDSLVGAGDFDTLHPSVLCPLMNDC